MWNKIKQLNDSIAIKMTLTMSTMWCVYAFFLWSLLPLVAPGLETVAMYVSSTVIQLVALPLIMVGQALLNKGSEERAAQDHAALIETIKDLHSIMTEESEEDAKIAAIQAILQTLTEINIAQSLMDIKGRLDNIESNIVPKYQIKAPD